MHIGNEVKQHVEEKATSRQPRRCSSRIRSRAVSAMKWEIASLLGCASVGARHHSQCSG